MYDAQRLFGMQRAVIVSNRPGVDRRR